jgi:hypothetical protein
LKPFEHLLAHLFGSFLHVVKFLFVLPFFRCQQTGKLSFALFKIGDVAASDFLNTVAYNTLVDHIVSLMLPLGGQSQVLLSCDVLSQLLSFLKGKLERNVLTISCSLRA